MGRKTTRKLTRSPNGAHVLAKRDSAGSVQFTTLTTSNVTQSATSGSPVSRTTTVGTPSEVLFDKVVAKASGMTAGQQGTVKLLHDGNTIANATGSNTTTLSTTVTNTTPDNVENATLKLSVTAGSSSLTITTWSREQQWV